VKDGFNPKTGEAVKAIRRRMTVDEDLPMKEKYVSFLEERIRAAVVS
jgi:hypothetical protein